MPMPTPTSGESRNDFVSRCMGDRTMMTDFPSQAQRIAVCLRQWRSKAMTGTARDSFDPSKFPYEPDD